MSLSSYNLLCVIAEKGSLANAAKYLHISPSAASHAVNALERELSVTLLKRDRNGASLTVNGEMLLPYIQSVVQADNLLAEEAARISGLEKGIVRIGVFESILRHWMPDILKIYSKEHPNIYVQIHQAGYSEVEQMLAVGTLDLGFVSLPTQECFSTVTLTHDRLLCITPPDFQPEKEGVMTPDDIRRSKLIISKRGYDRGMETYIKSNHLDINLWHDIDLDSAAITLVECGLGVSILPKLVLDVHPGNYKAYPLKSNPYRTIALATNRQQPESHASAKLLGTIVDYIEKISS
ncbi:MAG: LysR family transcriptional regulator [Dorea sp.]|nr:LysR family transcriptional regulator [Dorea sp.]